MGCLHSACARGLHSSPARRRAKRCGKCTATAAASRPSQPPPPPPPPPPRPAPWPPPGAAPRRPWTRSRRPRHPGWRSRTPARAAGGGGRREGRSVGWGAAPAWAVSHVAPRPAAGSGTRCLPPAACPTTPHPAAAGTTSAAVSAAPLRLLQAARSRPRAPPRPAHRDDVWWVDVGGCGVLHQLRVLTQAEHLAEEGDGLLRGGGRGVAAAAGWGCARSSMRGHGSAAAWEGSGAGSMRAQQELRRQHEGAASSVRGQQEQKDVAAASLQAGRQAGIPSPPSARLAQDLRVADVALVHLVKGQPAALALRQLLRVLRALDGNRAAHCGEGAAHAAAARAAAARPAAMAGPAGNGCWQQLCAGTASAAHWHCGPGGGAGCRGRVSHTRRQQRLCSRPAPRQPWPEGRASSRAGRPAAWQQLHTAARPLGVRTGRPCRYRRPLPPPPPPPPPPATTCCWARDPAQTSCLQAHPHTPLPATAGRGGRRGVGRGEGFERRAPGEAAPHGQLIATHTTARTLGLSVSTESASGSRFWEVIAGGAKRADAASRRVSRAKGSRASQGVQAPGGRRPPPAGRRPAPTDIRHPLALRPTGSRGPSAVHPKLGMQRGRASQWGCRAPGKQLGCILGAANRVRSSIRAPAVRPAARKHPSYSWPAGGRQ